MTLKQLMGISTVVLALTLAACAQNESKQVDEIVQVVKSQPAILGTFGIATENMDKTINPGDNFYEYVNGNWLKTVEIPSDRSTYGSFGVLRDQAEERVRTIIENAASAESPSADEKRIGDFYNAYQNTDRIEALGLAPIQAGLDRIRAAETKDDVLTLMSDIGLGLDTPASPYVYIDYYFDESEKGQEILAGYKTLATSMLTEAGVENAAARADAIMAFETALADGHWSRVKQRNRDLVYNKMSLSELEAMAPGIDWSAMMTGHASYLPKRIDEASFEFYGKLLRGQQEQRPRWKRAVGAVNGTLGEVVGKVYVAEHFPPNSKSQMKVLVENLRGAFKDGIDGLDWMADETKEQAQYKLKKFNPKIGYPDKWETYEGLNIDEADLIGTIQSARKWEWEDSIGQLGQPIDRDAWGITPQTVNAYYNSVLNEIVFPAAILDAPFFDPNADPAVNYGGIGAVIGHEMGHGFDDQGRKSDGDGVQRDWWTPEDAEAYKERAKALADQYSEFEPLPGENLDGNLGLGENIGDLTGVTMAYEAYKRSLGGKEAPVIDGFTGDQRFFMAWAQVWAIKWREAALSAQIKNGPHSPGEFRANGIVRNLQFAFN